MIDISVTEKRSPKVSISPCLAPKIFWTGEFDSSRSTPRITVLRPILPSKPRGWRSHYIWLMNGVAVVITFVCLLAACSGRSPREKDLAARLGIPVDDVKRLRTERGLSIRAIQQMTPDSVQDALHDDDSDNIRLRLRFQAIEQGLHRFPVGQSRVKASLMLEAMRSAVPVRRTTIAGVPVREAGGKPGSSAVISFTAGLNPDHTGWTFLGPTNIGGRTRAIVINPKDSKILWVASTGGGVWRSVDRGESFEPTNDLMADLAVSCLVLDPSSSNVLYAGTGEGIWQWGTRFVGAGIFKTVDGEKWKQVKSTSPELSADAFAFVNRLAVSKDGNTLLAATQLGIERGEDISGDGRAKREVDNGSVWEYRRREIRREGQ